MWLLFGSVSLLVPAVLWFVGGLLLSLLTDNANVAIPSEECPADDAKVHGPHCCY